MSTEASEIRVSGIRVQIVRKDIKNLHLGVYPPNGRVRVAAPLRVRDDAVRLAVIDKLGWIKKQQTKFAAQPRQSEREMVSGESHYFLGRRYRLRVVLHDGSNRVSLMGRSIIELRVRPEYSTKEREQVLLRWYRQRLREFVPPLLVKWEQILDVGAVDFRIRRMKTKQCLEYIIVHELAHLEERHHNENFIGILDRHLPRWRHLRKTLNEAPLGHAEWTY
jgi:predicted metal-dependent hydrolase